MVPTLRTFPDAWQSAKAQVRERMREAIQFHLEGMREDEQRIPTPTSTAVYVAVE